MRYTPGGQAITSFSVASNHRYKTSSGEQREETEWFKVSAFGRLADICNQYVTKGQQINVEGRLKGNSYAGNDGQPRYSLEIFATEMQMLSRRENNEDDSYDKNQSTMYTPPSGDTDDLPF